MSDHPSRRAAPQAPGLFWLQAERHGCDMGLLEESLALSTAERLRLHGLALERLEWLRSGRMGIHHEPRSTP